MPQTAGIKEMIGDSSIKSLSALREMRTGLIDAIRAIRIFSRLHKRAPQIKQ